MVGNEIYISLPQVNDNRSTVLCFIVVIKFDAICSDAFDLRNHLDASQENSLVLETTHNRQISFPSYRAVTTAAFKFEVQQILNFEQILGLGFSNRASFVESSCND